MIRAIGGPAGPASGVSLIMKTPYVEWPGALGNPPNTIQRIIHNTSGQTLTVKASAADGGVAVPTGTTKQVWSDGTNMFAI